MAKYNFKGKESNFKGKESNLDSSTESLVEIRDKDFSDCGNESDSDSPSESLIEISADEFNDGGDESYSDSSSGSLKEISADDFFKDGSRVSSRSNLRVKNYHILNSLACAQAVQDKHLETDKKDKVEKEEIAVFMDGNISDSEKEECETEWSFEKDRGDREVENNLEAEEHSEENLEFDKKVGLVLEELESIVIEAESSFEEACSKLQRCYIALKQMLLEGHRPVLHNLSLQAFMVTQTLYSLQVYSSRSLKNMDQNNELLLRLLIDVKNQYSICLTYEQIKEIDVKVRSLTSEAVGISREDPRLSSFIDDNSTGQSLFEPPTVSRTIKVNLNPLVNLYEDYDEDSLPSPTHNAPPFTALKPIGFEPQPAPTGHTIDAGKSSARSRHHRHRFTDPEGSSIPQNENIRKHRAVDDLVLEEHNVKRQRNKSVNPRYGPEGSSTPQNESVNPGDGPEGSSIPLNGNIRKHKAVDDLVLEEHTVKRQRSKSVNPKNGQASVGGDGWVKGNCISSHINNNIQSHNNFNGSDGGSAPRVLSSTVSVVPLPNGLKDIAVNPTIHMQLVKEQHSLEATGHENAAVLADNRSFNMLPATLDVEENLIGNPQIPVQTAAMNDIEISGTKCRDPRRILLDVVQKCKSPVSGTIKSTVSQPSDPQNKDNLIIPRAREQVQSVALTPQPTLSHNSLSQFKNDHDNIADEVLAITKPENEFKDATNIFVDMDQLLERYDKRQKVDIQKERARRIAEQNKMFAAHKLCLVLDLDHTLLNSAMFGEIDPPHEELLRKREAHDKKQQERHLYRLPHMGMWTKLRPGVRNFLEKASKQYELHVYTMGNKIYATEMTKILDPQGTLFSGRVISGGGDENSGGDDRVNKIKDLDGVLGMESSVVIIDDTVRVWPHHKLNLIAVERYMYFPSSRRQFGLNGPSLLELNRDERPESGTLASSLAVIEKVHKNFFSHQSFNEADVRTILAMEQRKILAGCKILFSRVFPIGEANPHLHPLWQTAEQFGAECTNETDEGVTHVVAISKGTDKVNWARSTGRFVVHPGWVEASALLYRRAKEQDFPVKK